MGIQGLFRELEPQSHRVALTKYALDHYTATSRRLRIAVDASIWSFQVQAGKGGHNPALRTLYYRLVRLLSHNVTPLFVFDGPKRPAFKRGHKTQVHLTPALIRLCKKLLKIFGIPFHTAPGEAEAECAVLQQAGVVDAVLSEDVDTLMFGATKVLRDWGPAAKGASTKIPTHISVYDAQRIKTGAKLDRSGMVLIALMHGGDYLPEGLPGCGIKTAMEAAAAGFGEELCALVDGDDEGLMEWRERLQKELSTNVSKKFSKRNARIKIPEGFPNRELLTAYYTPIVSDSETVERIRQAIDWDADADVHALREYARKTFEWRGTGGAIKFVRTLAPALMARWVMDGKHNIGGLVEGVHGLRSHCSTDGCAEVRIAYTPANVIQIDPVREAEDDELEASEQRGLLDDDEGAIGEDTPRGWVSDKPERIWVLEMHARRTLGEHFDRWENKKNPRAKKQSAASTTTTAITTKQQMTLTAVGGRTRAEGGLQTLDKFLTVSTGNVPSSSGSDGRIGSRELATEPEPALAEKKKTDQRKRVQPGKANGNITHMFTKITKATSTTTVPKAPVGRENPAGRPDSESSVSSVFRKRAPIQEVSSDDEVPSFQQLITSTPRKSKPKPFQAPAAGGSPSSSEPDEPPIRTRQRLQQRNAPQKSIPTDNDDDDCISSASQHLDSFEPSLPNSLSRAVERSATPPPAARSLDTAASIDSPTRPLRAALCAIDLTGDSPEPVHMRKPSSTTRAIPMNPVGSREGLRIKEKAGSGKGPIASMVGKRKTQILVLDLTDEP